MISRNILINAKGNVIAQSIITKEIEKFGASYCDAIKEIIVDSKVLDDNGERFVKCASRILSNFKMTRSGPFHKNTNERLRACWDAVGTDLIAINKKVRKSWLHRERYLLELSEPAREELIAEIWRITKRLLPFTMGKTSYGLVGASKILFSVFPEIVLPVDNAEWLHVFKTVDLGDVLHYMVSDIQKWEEITKERFDELDPLKRLTTLPSVYNVMAMAARPETES